MDESTVLPEWLPHTVPQSSPKDKTTLQHVEEPFLRTGDVPELVDRREGGAVVEELSPIIAPQPPRVSRARDATIQVLIPV